MCPTGGKARCLPGPVGGHRALLCRRPGRAVSRRARSVREGATRRLRLHHGHDATHHVLAPRLKLHRRRARLPLHAAAVRHRSAEGVALQESAADEVGDSMECGCVSLLHSRSSRGSMPGAHVKHIMYVAV